MKLQVCTQIHNLTQMYLFYKEEAGFENLKTTKYLSTH